MGGIIRKKVIWEAEDGILREQRWPIIDTHHLQNWNKTKGSWVLGVVTESEKGGSEK